MKDNVPLVTVITIFLDAEDFIEEAIESVLGQTYQNWELFLVDDGSIDASTDIARRYSAQNPGQIRYLEHPGHQNRGMSASRNLGARNAQGGFIAYLDADDVWLPDKLERQVEILEARPEAAMLYGNTEYWYSWTEDPGDRKRDFVPDLGIKPDTLVRPPYLLPKFLVGEAAVPCTCSLLVRSNALDRIGGFEESFRGMYEDQAFYAKIILNEPVYVSGNCLERYRQHTESNVSIAKQSGDDQFARRNYLVWLEKYLTEQSIRDHKIWVPLRKQLWLNSHFSYSEHSIRAMRKDNILRWIKKWLLRFEENFLPSSISDRMWFQSRANE